MPQTGSDTAASSPRSRPPDLPRRRWVVVVLSVLAGALAASLWSFELVDRVIGDNVANTLLGYDAKETPISGLVAGTVFAFVTGLAGAFTACNIAVFGAIAPMTHTTGLADGRGRLSPRPGSRPRCGRSAGCASARSSSPPDTAWSAYWSGTGSPNCRRRRSPRGCRCGCCRPRSSSG